MFARGAKLLQEAELVASSNFGNEYGPARVIAAVNEVCDKHASDVVVSFLRSDRIQQALAAVSPLLLLMLPLCVLARCVGLF